jgi:hypothetical protein
VHNQQVASIVLSWTAACAVLLMIAHDVCWFNCAVAAAAVCVCLFVMAPLRVQTVASIIMLGFMLVGGYYVRGIPSWISWIRYLSFVYWGL